MYIAFIPPVQDWETAEWDARAPIRSINCLCDLVNAPAKDGATVHKILCLQLERLGCSVADLVSGSTDGGGENEGKEGVHALIEEVCPLYVRRRGLEHLAWNYCSAGLSACSDLCHAYRDLSTYLHEGVTWSRLKQIATSPDRLGGLGLFGANTQADPAIRRACITSTHAPTWPHKCKKKQAMKDIFARAPPTVIDNRPETDMLFLQWLGPRERVLLQCCSRDVEQRELSAKAKASVETLRDPWASVRRGILQELLYRALYLHRMAMAQEYVVARSTHASVAERATAELLSMDVSVNLQEYLSLGVDELVAKGWWGAPWPRLVACAVGDDDDDSLRERAMEFHLAVSTRIATHLQLSFENTARTQWLAGAMLNPCAAVAQQNANLLQDHLLRTPLKNCTGFEAALRTDERAMLELGVFADIKPACLLWRGGGRFEYLYKLLAPRFLPRDPPAIHHHNQTHLHHPLTHPTGF